MENYILKELNAYNIIDSVAENSMFSNFHKGIIAIANAKHTTTGV